MSSRTILYIAWGDAHVAAIADAMSGRMPAYPVLLVTDLTTDVDSLPARVRVERRPLELRGKSIKAEVMATLPDDLETVLFIDTDTRVIGDISLGFDKAERFGMALAPAPHYSLADFRSYGRVMRSEGVSPRGELVYNSGVMFFSARDPRVRAVFLRARDLAKKYLDGNYGDQPHFSFAMELEGFNPYTLSPSFNHRGFGELISGSIRIWHSYTPLPKGAGDLEPGYLHRFFDGKFERVLKVPL